MLRIFLALFLVNLAFAVDQVTYIEYGRKVPTDGPFDLWFNYDADGYRDCIKETK